LYPDQGDLAAGYGSAWHTGQGSAWRLGTAWSGEATSTTGGDDANDDGVSRNYTQSWNDGTGEVSITVTGPAGQWACLNAWLDYSDGSATPTVMESPNGLFDANEHVVNNLALQAGAGQALSWSLEAGVINANALYPMRFRLVADPNNDGSCGDVTLRAPAGGALPTGRADGGEVEDYIFLPGPMAITLASFEAVQQGADVQLTWETTSELHNRGFNLYRGLSSAGWDTQINASLIPSQAQGSSSGFLYTWNDQAGLVAGQTYWYWLEDVDTQGIATLHGPISVVYNVPTAVELSGLHAASHSGNTAAWLLVAWLIILALGAGFWHERHNALR